MQGSVLGLSTEANKQFGSNLAALQSYYASAAGELGQAGKAGQYLQQGLAGAEAEAASLTDQMLLSESDMESRLGDLAASLGRQIIIVLKNLRIFIFKYEY